MTLVTAPTAAHIPAADTLLGRDYELAELMSALDDIRSGRGRLFLLTGDAGIGKTRLLEAVADAAEPTEVTVLWGRCWEGGGAAPYWPWSQVLHAVLRDLGSSGSSSYPDAVLRYISELVDERAVAAGSERLSSVADLPGARAALFDAIVTFLRIRSAEGGLVIALEDLHAADEASLRLLQVAVRELSTSPVLIVGTYRDAEVRSSPSLHQLMSAIARQGRRIALSGLDEGCVALLVERTTGGARVGADARVIHDTTDGNPFFVQEVARLLVAEHQIARDVVAAGRVPVPEEVHALIRRRLDPLPAETYEALSVASVLGRHFEVGVVAALCDRSPEALLDILDRGAELGVVEDRGLGRWQFSHALLREALYDDMRPSQRVVLHRRAGEAIERVAGDDVESRTSELAHHFFEAARGGEGARAVRHCSIAARHAAAAMAFEEAALLYGRALEALALSPPVEEHTRYELLMGLAQAQQRAGDLALARETFMRAVKAARALASPERLARAAIAYTGFIENKADDSRTSVLEEALAVLPPEDSALRARILVLLANRVKSARFASPEASERNWQRGWQLATDGIEMARRVADPENRWSVLWDWHFSAMPHRETLDERLRVADELVELAVASGNPERLVLARQWRAGDYFAAGDIQAFAAELEVARREADELRMPFLLWGIVMMQAGLALLQGDLEGGERFAREALHYGERAEFADVENVFAQQMAELHLHRAEFPELERILRGFIDRHGLRGKTDCIWMSLGRIAFLTGRPDEARAIYRDQLPGFAPERFVRSGARLCCPTSLAQLAWLLQADEGIDRIRELLLPHAGTHVFFGIGHNSLGACDRYLAQIAALQDRFDEAEEYFLSARELNVRMQTPLWEAHTLADHAQMLVRRGRAVDRERAGVLAEAAAVRFAGLGMRFWEGRARELLVGQPAATPAPSMPTLQRTRLLQEGEYWAFHYEGHVARLRDSKGLRYLARLLRNPGQELHALDLVVGDGGAGGASGRVPEREVTRTGAGDAGAMLDPQAKAAYRRRLEDLRDELDEATYNNDVGRAARAQEEMDFLLAELSAAVGLGGRDRKAASDAERARQSVTRAIKGAIERLGEAHAPLGDHLRSAVRTGIYSSYVPDPRSPISWDD